MRSARGFVGLLLGVGLATTIGANRAAAAGDGFPLKDGDTWVMAGDSITAQHLHSNYFEAFCYARYPKLTFRFRNSGVGGDTVPKVLARFDWDVAAWKPTVVSVELGMNDQGGYSVEQYIANMGKLSEKIRSVGARPVFFTSSPINNGETMARLAGNHKLDQFATALKQFADQEKAPFADQFHAVIDVWGKNKPNEPLANALPAMRAAAHDDKLPGVEHLRAFLADLDKSHIRFVSMQGDAVHPGPPGQLMMAAALLKELGAEGFVSSATLDSEGKVLEARGCTIKAVKKEDGKLSFDRLDDSLPFPIPDEARSVVPLFPTILDLSRYTLKITGLPEGHYRLAVDRTAIATLTAKDLEQGVNLTAYDKGPIALQCKQVLGTVAGKEALVGQWRNLSRQAATGKGNPGSEEALRRVAEKAEEADRRIHATAQPMTRHFEIARAE
jgi:lysophospholipase L1-like esterase